jgi:peptidyl-prolyl cis-trans isomerase SurA
MKRLFVLAAVLLALLPDAGRVRAQTAPAASGGKIVVLDRVVAVINGEAILQSDVDEEMHFAALEPFQSDVAGEKGTDTRQFALRRLISRSLIEQQMKEQQQFNIDVSDTDVQKSLDELRSHLPICAKYNCKTIEGWDAFLDVNGLTNDEVIDHWRQRLAILRFIDQRFRTGIRISENSIEDYYAKSVVPVFAQQQQKAPPLKDVSARIQDVLLEQQVNLLLQDWLKSLQDEGSVRIIDPAYAGAVDLTPGSQMGGKE